MAFFLDGIAEVAQQAGVTARRLVGIFMEHADAIEGMGRSRGTARRMHELLKKPCVLSIPVATEELGVSFPTAKS